MIIQTKEDYLQLINLLVEEDYVAADVETEEFSDVKTHPFDLDLDGIGVYSENCQAYIPVRFVCNEFQRVLDTCKIIFHNAKFDLNIFQKEGFNIDNLHYEDTMLMSWLVNENRASHALKSLAEKVLKVSEEDIVKFGDVMERPTKESLGLFHHMYDEEMQKWEEQLGHYCIDDCKYTYQLFKLWKPILEKDDIWNEYRKVEIPLVRVLLDMENRGISLDVDYLRNIGNEIEKDIISYQAEIWKEVGEEFDINSPKQLSDILYVKGGYKVTNEYKTSTGANSTSSGALEYLARAYPDKKLPKLILQYRDVFKLHSTYIKGLIQKQREGIIYGSFRQLGAKTGRLSSSNPNLQQLPRRDDSYNIRKAFKPRDGYTFIISDLSQIELRVLAFMSKDENMCRAFASGDDIHAWTANAMGVERVVAKSINFGIAYGATAHSIARNLGITAEEAQKFVDLYFKKFPKIELFITQVKNTLKKRYAVKTITKRKRRFPKYPWAKKSRQWTEISRMERQAVNSCIQGSAADIIKVQMREVHKNIKPYDAHILVQIHDEVIVECPIGKEKQVEKVVKETMENAIILPGVPIITEPEICNEWKK